VSLLSINERGSFWEGIIGLLGVYSRGLYIRRPAPCIGGL